MRSVLSALILICLIFSCGKSDRPIGEDSETPPLTWWSSNRAEAYGCEMEDMPVYRELAARTGIELDFIHPPAGQYHLRFRRMLASGSGTDIISHDFHGDYPGGMEGAVRDRVILPLDGAILKSAPHFSRYLEENREIALILSREDGTYPCFPSVNPLPETATYMGPFIRADLLEKYDRKPPETVLQWEEILTLMKEDPQVDIPLIFYGGNIRDTQFLISTFDIYWDFFIKEGHVVYGPALREFASFVRLLAKWYEKGWIERGVLMNNRKIYNQNVKRKRVGIYVDYVSNIYNYTQNGKEENPGFRLIPLKNPRLTPSAPLPSGHGTDKILPYASAYLTEGTSDPARPAALLDYGYSPEGNRLFNFGIEGESYRMEENEPRLLETLFLPGSGETPLKLYLTPGPYVKDREAFFQSLILEEQKRAVRLWAEHESTIRRLPFSILPAKESSRLAPIQETLKAYVDEAVIDFVTGKRDLSELDGFPGELERLGLAEALAVYGALY